MIEALIEDATGQVRAKQVKVTHRKLKQGQWIETIQYYPIADYYKNEIRIGGEKSIAAMLHYFLMKKRH